MDKIKGAYFRTVQTVQSKVGKADNTVDEEYDSLHRHFSNSFTLSENFNKHTQALIENFNALTAIMQFISEDLTELYLHSDDPNKKKMTQEITQVAAEIENQGVQPFQKELMANVYQQVAEYILKFEEVKKLHKQRNDLVKEYDYFRNRVQKMSETQSKDPMALPKEKEKLKKAKEDMEQVQSLTVERMQALMDEKPLVFAHVTEQLIGSLISYHDKSKRAFDKLQVHSSSPSSANSRAAISQAPVRAKPQPVAPQRGGAIPPKFNCDWHYLDADVNQQGPLSFLQLKQKYQKGDISGSTHVFGGEMSDWQTVSAVPDLVRALSS